MSISSWAKEPLDRHVALIIPLWSHKPRVVPEPRTLLGGRTTKVGRGNGKQMAAANEQKRFEYRMWLCQCTSLCYNKEFLGSCNEKTTCQQEQREQQCKEVHFGCLIIEGIRKAEKKRPLVHSILPAVSISSSESSHGLLKQILIHCNIPQCRQNTHITHPFCQSIHYSWGFACRSINCGRANVVCKTNLAWHATSPSNPLLVYGSWIGLVSWRDFVVFERSNAAHYFSKFWERVFCVSKSGTWRKGGDVETQWSFSGIS